MSEARTGQCLCGAIRYRMTAEPVMTLTCHCKNCQRQAGSALSVIVGLPRGGLEVEGEPTVYEDRGESGQAVYRKFCGTCGSPLFTEAASAPQLDFVKAGTLDDVSWLEPSLHCWTKSAQPWVALGDIPAIEGNPS